MRYDSCSITTYTSQNSTSSSTTTLCCQPWGTRLGCSAPWRWRTPSGRSSFTYPVGTCPGRKEAHDTVRSYYLPLLSATGGEHSLCPKKQWVCSAVRAWV